MNEEINIGDAAKVARICGNPQLADMLTNSETVWAGINKMQAFLTEKNCSIYLDTLFKRCPSPIAASPALRVYVFLVSYK